MPRYFTFVFKVRLSHWIKLHKTEFHACPEYQNEAWLMRIYSTDCGSNCFQCRKWSVFQSLSSSEWWRIFLQSRSVQGLPDFSESSQGWVVEPTSLFLRFMNAKEEIFSTSLLLSQWRVGDKIQQYTEADLVSHDL